MRAQISWSSARSAAGAATASRPPRPPAPAGPAPARPAAPRLGCLAGTPPRACSSPACDRRGREPCWRCEIAPAATTGEPRRPPAGRLQCRCRGRAGLLEQQESPAVIGTRARRSRRSSLPPPMPQIETRSAQRRAARPAGCPHDGSLRRLGRAQRIARQRAGACEHQERPHVLAVLPAGGHRQLQRPIALAPVERQQGAGHIQIPRQPVRQRLEPDQRLLRLPLGPQPIFVGQPGAGERELPDHRRIVGSAARCAPPRSAPRSPWRDPLAAPETICASSFLHPARGGTHSPPRPPRKPRPRRGLSGEQHGASLTIVTELGVAVL